MKYNVRVGDENFAITTTHSGSGEVMLNDANVKVDFRPVHDNLYHVLLNDVAYTVQVERGKSEVVIGPYTFAVQIEDERNAAIKKLSRSTLADNAIVTLKAPMPGLVVRLDIKAGDAVKKGQGAVVIEAMKMENEIKVSHSGIVVDVMVSAGMTVEKDTPLLRIQPAA